MPLIYEITFFFYEIQPIQYLFYAKDVLCLVIKYMFQLVLNKN